MIPTPAPLKAATADGPSLRPSLALFGTEPVRALWQAAGHFARRSPDPEPGHASDGHTVVLFPGLGTDGLAMRPLSGHLRSLGYRALDWGQGFNFGPDEQVDRWLQSLSESVLARAAAAPGERISLIGWSLGGFYAREIARLHPERVHRVISIGTPFNGRIEDSNVGWLFRVLNGRTPPDDAALRQRLATPPPVPTTSIFSRGDGVVAWQTCVHEPGFKQADDVEVDGSHMGMGFNPEVFQAVTRALATSPAAQRRSAARAARAS